MKIELPEDIRSLDTRALFEETNNFTRAKETKTGEPAIETIEPWTKNEGEDGANPEMTPEDFRFEHSEEKKEVSAFSKNPSSEKVDNFTRDEPAARPQSSKSNKIVPRDVSNTNLPTPESEKQVQSQLPEEEEKKEIPT